MALKNQVPNVYSVGLQNAGSYLVSGTPYLARRSVNSGEEVKIEFPYVTKNVTIRIPSPPNNAINVGNQDGSWLSTSETSKADSYLPEAGTSGKDFTYSWWMKDTHTGPASQLLIMTMFKADGSFTDELKLRYNNSTDHHFQLVGAGGNAAVTAADTVNNTADGADGNFHHILITQIDSKVYLYIDGNPGSNFYNANLPAVIDTIKWGWNGGGGRDSAIYDEATVFTSGFTQAEVSELYNSGEWYNPKSHSKASSLIAWWTMGDSFPDGRAVGNFTGFPWNGATDPSLGTNGPSWFYNNGDSTERNVNAIFFSAADDFAELVPGPFTSQTTGILRAHMLSTSSSPHGANVIANKHYRELQGYGSTITLPIKTRELYLTGVDAQTTFEVIAELTNIPADKMYALTGSGIDE
jgi:hypothetical protein